jgi:hypothetical protein
MAFAATTTAKADAAYSDTEGTACEGAVNVLTALGVVDGYTDGTYRPEQVVTRAEMAKLVVTALGVANYATATTSQFTDMSAAAWAIPYVEYAANLNIVNGYGNGKFGPNDTVTYEQVATMIVRALGYTDEANEMNGSWPAIYVQKATALGIFEDVVNGGATGADRGDVAIMLYNAIDIPQVYVDSEGVTQTKNGNDNGYSTIIGTLNNSGDSSYTMIDGDDADDAVLDIRSYVGAVGKVYTDKNGDVIAIGDLKSEFLTGTVNGDGDKFTTTDGTAYTVENGSFSKLNSDGTSSSTPTTVPLVKNGLQDGTLAQGSSTTGALDYVPEKETVTIAANVSGKTIKNIYSVSVWNCEDSTDKDLAEDVDLDDIKDAELFGYDFKTDDNGDIDYSTFILNGVDKLDDIAVDNVVYVYADANDIIRRVDVGTETVEGTVTSYTAGVDPVTGYYTNNKASRGTKAKLAIDSTSYNTTKATKDSTLGSGAFAGDDDGVGLNDDIKAYLDFAGNIYEVEQQEANVSSYALLLDYDLLYDVDEDDNVVYTKLEDSAALNTNDSKIKVLTADGDVLTLTLKQGADIKTSIKDSNDKNLLTVSSSSSSDSSVALSAGDIISYKLNSSGLVKSVTIEADTDMSTAIAEGDKTPISAKGYYKSKAISENALIFAIDDTKSRKGSTPAKNVSATPSTYIDEDDVSITKLSSILDTDNVGMYSNIVKSGKYTALVLDNGASSSNVYYGIVTGATSIDSDSISADWQVDVLVGGTTNTYYWDDSLKVAPVKNQFYAFKLNASGYISEIATDNGETYGTDSTDTAYNGIFEAVGDSKATTLGFLYAENKNDITAKGSGTVIYNNTYTVDTDAVYVKWSASDSVFNANGSKSDVTGAEGKYVFFFDTDKNDDKDGVADLVVIANASSAAGLLASDGKEATEPTISTDLDDYETVTKGDELTLSVSVEESVKNGTLSYQWQQSTSSNGKFTDITDANGSEYTVSTSAEGVTYYKVKVTNTVENSVGIETSAYTYSKVVKVTVTADSE